MGSREPRDRPTLIWAATIDNDSDCRVGDVITAVDAAGIDMTRIPQELAGHIPSCGTPWRRGSCSPAVDTPDGHQALCYGTLEELRFGAPRWRDPLEVNGARTLWVVTMGDG